MKLFFQAKKGNVTKQLWLQTQYLISHCVKNQTKIVGFIINPLLG